MTSGRCARRASASFHDGEVWIPRGVPTYDDYVEVASSLTISKYGYQPELEIEMDSVAEARGVAGRVKSKFFYAAIFV